MKIKNQAKTKSNHKAKSSKRSKKYAEHYLGMILVIFLLLEAGFFTLTSHTDWQSGMGVLDMTPTVAETTQQMQEMFAPMAMVVDGVNAFYSQATDQAMSLLNANGSENDLAIVIDGVNEFYNQAADQMMAVLDIHSPSDWVGNVAGISVTR